MKRIVSITLFLASVLLWAAAGSYGNEGRAIKRISDLTHESGKLGGFHALIVAISDYQDDEIPDLKSPIKDARALDRVLRKNYGFETQLLLDREATRETIYNTLRNLADSTKEDDSILIYYAGHGDRDRTYDDGWWIPADASAGRPTTYLDNTQVQKAMRSMKARHVLLISDSCYSGTLFGQGRAMPSVITEKYYLDLYNEKSRWGMTSGNKEPVADRGTGGHSVFAYQLIKALEKSDKPYQSTQEIYTLIAPIVSNNSEQTPLCRPIRNTGDQGGEFVFVMSRDGAVATLPSPPTTPEGLPVESDVLTDDVLRPDGRDVDHPALKFRNSLDMMFVYLPPGVFEMGSPLDEPGRNDDELHHRVTLTRGFYMQTTEVTKGQWEAVMGTRPWSGKKYVIDNADSPAVFVSWEDCQEFIKEINRKEGVDKYGLPSEAEWEYACRARSATKYFFGRHDGGLMNYAWIKKNTWNLGRRYAHMVGTKKANPWGLFDMHGNVWEWCRDWYGEYPSSPVTDPEGPLWGTEKVLRGGSWLRYARYCRSASRFKRAMNVASRHIGFRLKAEVSPVRIPGAAEKAVSPDREFYESTLAMYREGRYEEAISDLRSLIKQHPDSALADNAQFWIGECYMSLKQYERAILAYQKVIHSRAKANSKVPNAMLRQGRAFFKKGDKTSSRLLLKKIIKKYPGSGEAKIAKKWLKAME